MSGGTLDGALREFDPAELSAGRHQFRLETATGATPAACDVVAVKGRQEGPTLLLMGAVHGDEYEGPTALLEVLQSLAPAELRGTVVGIPVANEPAFFARARCAPEDGLDLARAFPGESGGSVTQQIAASLTSIIARADALVDLHAAGTCYTLKPWVGYGLVANPDIRAAQRRMAVAFGLDFVWATPLKPGRSLSEAAARAVPAVYVEMTGAGGCRPADVKANRQGVIHVARCLGLLDGSYPATDPRFLRETEDPDEAHLQLHHPAPASGLFYPTVELWQKVGEGEAIGVLRRPGGETIAKITAQRAGRVALLRTTPPVAEGDFLAVIAPV